MNVLVACEESQRVCAAFRAKGHNAFSCDIMEPSGGYPEWHIKEDCLPLLNGNCSFTTMDGTEHQISGKWDLLICHPPCTYLSAVGTRWMYKDGKVVQERYQKGVEAAEFFMRCLSADCDRIAVENPVPFKMFGLPQYTQIIHPYWFGEPYDKRTCLWLKGLPKLVPTDMVTDINNCNQKKGEAGKSWYTQGGKDRQKNRAKTFLGIARAFAEQWGSDTDAGDKSKPI